MPNNLVNPTIKDKKVLSKGRYTKLKNKIREGTMIKTKWCSFIIKSIIVRPNQNQRYKTYVVEIYLIEENRKDTINIGFWDGIVNTDGYGWAEDYML